MQVLGLIVSGRRTSRSAVIQTAGVAHRPVRCTLSTQIWVYAWYWKYPVCSDGCPAAVCLRSESVDRRSAGPFSLP